MDSRHPARSRDRDAIDTVAAPAPAALAPQRTRKAILAAAGGAAVVAALTKVSSASAADSDVPGAVILAPDTAGRNRVQATANTVPLSVRGHSAQSFDLQQWQDSNGNPLASIRYDGAFVSRSSVRIWGKTVNGQSVAQPLVTFGTNADGTGDKMKWSMGLDVADSPQNDDFFIGRVNEDMSVSDHLYFKKYPDFIASGLGFVPPPQGTSFSISSPDPANNWTAMWLRQGSQNTGSLLKGTTASPNTLFEFDRYGRLSIGRGPSDAATLDVQKDAVVSPLIARFRDSSGAHRVGISGLGVLDLSSASGRVVVTGAAGVGDKIALFSDQYGIGVQGGRLVTYVGPGAALAVRRHSGGGAGASSGTDGVTLFENGTVGVGTGTQFGGGTRVVGIQNATVVPNSNPSGGGVLFAQNGALKWRGSSGTVTTIAPA